MTIAARSNLALVAVLLTPSLLFADYTYQETTQLTGGSMLRMIKMAGAFSSQARKAGDPIVSTVYLKGNRMAKVNPDTTEIIDLDKETITNIDNLKHTYTVVTFEQLRQQMEKAMQEAQKRSAEHPAQQQQPQQPNDVKMSFDVKVRNTGVEKQISGISSHEAILTMTMNATDQKTQQTGAMAVTNDMWLVPEIPGYDQVKEFDRKMAEKMALVAPQMGMDMSRMLATNPGATEALKDMGKEVEKIKGVPIMQVMRMGSTVDGKPLPAASEAPLPPDNSPAMPSGSEIAKQSAASAITSKLGGFGFGGFGKKKKSDDQPAQDPNAAQNAAQAQATAAVLMETQITTSNFSSDPVDGSHFEVPAGFKQVQPPTR
ncbi:hypothetical protein DYQ86_13635 [Acidobacteria bacterium AB60]|nr:hypothetical protein DYQ86_13635 [Acidobacteria bacterium AB60]